MWIAPEQRAIIAPENQYKCRIFRSSIKTNSLRICERPVDDVWAEMYESNQPSNHYNKVY